MLRAAYIAAHGGPGFASVKNMISNRMFLLICLFLASGPLSAAPEPKCPKHLAAILRFDSQEYREADILKTLLIDNIPYGLKGVHHQNTTTVVIKELRRQAPEIPVFTLQARAKDLELTKVGENLVLMSLMPAGQESSLIHIRDLKENTAINELQIEDKVTSLQFLSQVGKKYFAAAFAPTSRKVYVFEMITGDMGSTRVRKEIAPLWTQIFSDELLIDRDRVIITRSGPDIYFTLKTKKTEQLMGIAPALLLEPLKN